MMPTRGRRVPLFSAVLVLTACAAGSGAARGPSFASAPGSPVTVGARPADIAAADLDGDGRLDVVTANGGSNQITVLLGDGRGGLAPAPGPPVATAAPPHLLAVGDLDRDGRPDVVATSHDSHGVEVWLGQGGGRFAPAPGSPFAALPAGKAHNHGLAAGDLDGDGDLDITTADDVAHVLTVLLGDGRGRFAPARVPSFPVGRAPYPHALGDLDGDGWLDVVAPNTESSDVSVLLGDGRGGLAHAPGSPVALRTARPYFAVLGDLDGNKTLDAVVTHDDTSRVTVLMGDGRGRLAPGPGFDAGHRPWKAALPDLDGDGRLDLALAAGGRVLVFVGDGRGGFAPVPGSPFAVGRGAWSLAVGDLDGDRRLDLMTADNEAGTVSVLLAR